MQILSAHHLTTHLQLSILCSPCLTLNSLFLAAGSLPLTWELSGWWREMGGRLWRSLTICVYHFHSLEEVPGRRTCLLLESLFPRGPAWEEQTSLHCSACSLLSCTIAFLSALSWGRKYSLSPFSAILTLTIGSLLTGGYTWGGGLWKDYCRGDTCVPCTCLHSRSHH